MRLGIDLYKLARRDYYYTNGKMADIAQSTVRRINKKTVYFLKSKFLNIRFQIKVTIP